MKTVLILWGMLMSLLFSNLYAQSDAMIQPEEFFFRKGEKFVGTDAFDMAWLGFVARNEPLVESYSLGLRGGYFLTDAWAIGGGWSEAFVAPVLPLQPERLRWSMVSVFTRYMIRLHPKWTPFGELALSYAAAFHSEPTLRTGAGAAAIPRLGIAFRLNRVWSIEAGARLIFMMGPVNGFAHGPTELPARAGWGGVRGALTYHFGQATKEYIDEDADY